MANYLRIFGLIVPLAITRTWLYFTTTLTSSIFILLPLSIITYYKYYTTLVPLANSPVIPLTFTSPIPATAFPSILPPPPYNSSSVSSSTKENNEMPKMMMYSSDTVSPHFTSYKFDPSSLYVLKLRISIQCPNVPYDDPMDYGEYQTITPTPSFLSAKYLINKVQYSLLNNRGDSFLSQGTFILNCDSHIQYQLRNSFVPYNLRHWFPPKLSDLSRLQTFEFDLFDILGSKIDSKTSTTPNKRKGNGINNNDSDSDSDYYFDNFVLLLSQADKYLIEDIYTQAWFEIKWTGFRYYLVKYYYTCYILGTAVFFLVSLTMSILTGYGMLWFNHQRGRSKNGRNTSNIKIENPTIKVERK